VPTPIRKPKISLVTCSYQQGRVLDATIRSVLDQGYENLEYIIMDGGSKDESVDVIKRHEARISHWVSEKDRGQTHALQKGFDLATGEIFGWLCSDDLLLPGALEAVGTYFAEHPEVDMIYGDSLWIDAKGDYIRPKKEMSWNKFVFLFDYNFISQPACFWRRSLQEKVGGLQEHWNLNMDSDLWLRFAQHTQPVHVNHYLAGIRDYPEQKTRALQGQGMQEWNALISREAPALSRLPRQPLKGLARVARITTKGLQGGYTARPPADLLARLGDYRIL